MKKLLFGFAIAAATLCFSVTPTVKAEAQSSKLTVKTITATDTTVFTNVPSHIRAFQYTYTETSGTSAGKYYLEGTVNGTWVILDSLALADVATAQTKVTAILPSSGTTYLSYRARNTNTSSATGVIRFAYLKRADE